MGLFSDKCVKCGAAVKKRAKFCSACGSGAPLAWTQCVFCGKWMGINSPNCPHCGKAVPSAKREGFKGIVGAPEPGLFIQRVEISAIRSDSVRSLVVEDGSFCVLVRDGAAARALVPGAYDIESLTAGSKSASILVVESRNLAIPFEFKQLRSAEDMKLDMYFEVSVRAEPANAAALNAAFAGEDSVSLESLPSILSTSGAMLAAKDIASSKSIDDIVKSAAARTEFENALSAAMKSACAVLGLELIHVTAVQFFGQDYERLRDASGDAEMQSREAAAETRTREILKSDQMHKFKNEAELRSYVELIAHEHGIDARKLAAELDMLQEELSHRLRMRTDSDAHDRTMQSQSFSQEELSGDDVFRRSREEAEARHGRILDSEGREHGRTEGRKDLSFEREVGAAKLEDSLKETYEWMKLRQQRDTIELSCNAAKLAEYSRFSPEQLAVVLPPDQVETMLRARELESRMRIQEKKAELQLRQLDLQAGLSPEQILAVKAAESPEIANAIAMIASAREKSSDDKLRLVSEASDRLERVMQKAIESQHPQISSNNSQQGERK